MPLALVLFIPNGATGNYIDIGELYFWEMRWREKTKKNGKMSGAWLMKRREYDILFWMDRKIGSLLNNHLN